MARCTTGELVRAHRLVVGLTQTAFAERSGLTSSALSAIERNQAHPTPDILHKIARTFAASLLKPSAA